MAKSAGERALRLLSRALVVASLALSVVLPLGSRIAAAGTFVPPPATCPTSGPGVTVGVCGNLLSTALGNLIGEATGNDVTGDVDAANTAALGSTPGVPPLSFSPQTPSQSRARAAFDALAYGDTGPVGGAPMPGSTWSVWGSARGTQWNTAFANPYGGNQFNLTGGIGKLLGADLVVGALAGYESFDYTINSIGGRLKGSGGTIGGYVGWRFLPNWRVDGVVGWSSLGYDAAYNGGVGSFKAGRWLASGGVTGTYNHGMFVVEPSARIYALFENRDQWTDNLSVVNPAQNSTVGRGSVGARLVYPMMTSMGTLSPYFGLYGDWRFASTDGLLAGYESIAGLSARLTGGIGLMTAAGTRFALDGEWGGIGANYSVWSVRGRAAVPF